jgi:ribose transport system permease protein
LTSTDSLRSGDRVTREGRDLSRLSDLLRRRENLERIALPVLWLAAIVIFGAVEPGTFLNVRNFQSIFGFQGVSVILAIGLLVPLTTGDFDLSVAATMGMSSMVVAVLNVNDHWPIGLAILAALGIGLMVGIVNAFFVVRIGVNAFIVTLATATILDGLALAVSNESAIGGISNSLVNLTNQEYGGLPVSFYFEIVIALVIWYVMVMTPTGRKWLFIGRNVEVARLSGIATGRLRASALIIAAVLSAVAGVVNAGTIGAADPTSAAVYLLPAYAAAFLGATTFTPGRFNVWGTVITIYFLDTCFSGLQLLGIANWIQQIFYGSVLVVAVAVAQGSGRGRLKRRRRRAGAAVDAGTMVPSVTDSAIAAAGGASGQATQEVQDA